MGGNYLTTTANGATAAATAAAPASGRTRWTICRHSHRNRQYHKETHLKETKGSLWPGFTHLQCCAGTRDCPPPPAAETETTFLSMPCCRLRTYIIDLKSQPRPSHQPLLLSGQQTSDNEENQRRSLSG
ncbi:hypothetical protein E2C01_018219 [Portunus trituberculatus]|uniref:Uncharacterized protein n=1 Tax=Portunus trituberculatus TaxID=210409 RepID=A0A5B7DVK0_PORTR|nr:hypothetical protein [Portunus trituberculatus]